MRPAAWLLVAAALAVTAIAAGQLRSAAATRRSGTESARSLPRVSFVKAGGGWVVEATGLDAAQVARLRADASAAASVLEVRVATAEAGLPAMLGRYNTDGTTLRFTPAYSLVGGLTYIARLRPAHGDTVARELSATLTVPRAAKTSRTMVENIYPTEERVPANLLRMYIVFTAPMSISQSASHLRLVDENGQTVSGAFLQLEEELWDPGRRRLTVLFDPGRVKRGLRTNLERGAPLRRGRVYRVVVDAGWLDGDGAPLAAPFERSLRVGDADRRSPDPASWRIDPVRAGSQAPIVVAFDEPLDRALVGRSLMVVDDHGARIEGTVAVPDSAREWRFTPAHPWRPGSYRLRVSTDLEDIAGNSLRRVFDTDLRIDRSPETSDAGDSIELPIGSPTT